MAKKGGTHLDFLLISFVVLALSKNCHLFFLLHYTAFFMPKVNKIFKAWLTVKRAEEVEGVKVSIPEKFCVITALSS